MKLLCVGDINQDIITPKVSYFPLKDEQLIVNNFKWFLGGGAAITACAASSLGVNTTLVGAIGSDLIGAMLLKEIKAWGVKPLIKKTSTSTEVTFAVTFENTSRSFITTIGANKDLLLSDVPSVKGFNHLHVSSIYHLGGLQKSIEVLFNRARNAGLTISFDPGFMAGANPMLVKGLLPLVDVLFINEVELKKFGGAQFCTKRVPVVAVHLGPKGSIVFNKGKRYEAPAPKLKVVDSTGAGDVYNAGFLKSYMKGDNVETCLDNAMKAASFYVRQKEQVFPKGK